MADTIRILIVDDEPDFRETMGERLEAHGFEVTKAADGASALAAAQQGGFDLALIDLKMPGMDGIDLLKTLRRQHKFLEVIILTGFGSIESAVESTRAGAFDYLPKTCDFNELLEKLKEAYVARLEKKFAADPTLQDKINRILAQEDPMQIWFEAREKMKHKPGLLDFFRRLRHLDDNEK